MKISLPFEGRPPAVLLSYARMTLTLTRWPWHSTLTYTFRRRTCVPKAKFVNQCIQKLEPEQHTDTLCCSCDTTLDPIIWTWPRYFQEVPAYEKYSLQKFRL